MSLQMEEDERHYLRYAQSFSTRSSTVLTLNAETGDIHFYSNNQRNPGVSSPNLFDKSYKHMQTENLEEFSPVDLVQQLDENQGYKIKYVLEDVISLVKQIHE